MNPKRNVVAVFILLTIFLLFGHHTPAHADKSYGLPTLSRMPRYPDIRYADGGTFVENNWKMIVAPHTFTYDIYFEHGCWLKSFPRYIGRYWQISDICEFRPKPQFQGNSAPAVPVKTWIISYHYNENDLQILGGLQFPENSLKIVFSDDHGESWTMLKSSVVDEENNTVAAITDKAGGFMLMGGFVPPTTYYNYKEVKGISVERGHEFSLGQLILQSFEYIFMLIRHSISS